MTPSPTILIRINLMADGLQQIDKIDRRDIIAALRWWIDTAEWDGEPERASAAIAADAATRRCASMKRLADG